MRANLCEMNRTGFLFGVSALGEALSAILLPSSMPDKYAPPEFESFLIRFWHEPASQTWRGKVIHVSSRTACDFATWEQAVAFIRQFVPASSAAPTTGDTRTIEEEEVTHSSLTQLPGICRSSV